jgi:hypothetical protein
VRLASLVLHPQQRACICSAIPPLTRLLCPSSPACAADSDKLKKPPYAYWGELTSAGCSAVFGEAVSPSLFPAGATFDVVVDNNGAEQNGCNIAMPLLLRS